MIYRPGDCFLFKATSSPKPHLYIIIAEMPPVHVVVVNVSHTGLETCCMLDAKDHPFIEERSYVRYDMASHMAQNQIKNHLARSPGFYSQPGVCPVVLERVRQGARESMLIKPFLLTHIPPAVVAVPVPVPVIDRPSGQT